MTNEMSTEQDEAEKRNCESKTCDYDDKSSKIEKDNVFIFLQNILCRKNIFC